MKTLKIGIMLLALVLAAMVMVPMVSANEQTTAVSNIPLPPAPTLMTLNQKP